MEVLPDAIVQYILSHNKNARDVAQCNVVSKRWKDLTPYTRSLYFPRNCFENLVGPDHPETIVLRMISSIVRLEELIVYCPFSTAGLASWLLVAASSLRTLELRMDNLVQNVSFEAPTKMDIVGSAINLESLMLWGVLMSQPPQWDTFSMLKSLQIVGGRFEDRALSVALQACPNLTLLKLLGCEGLRSVSIEFLCLEECWLDFYGLGNCSLSVTSPTITLLDVQGCSRIRVRGTKCLRVLNISNNSGRVDVVDFGNLAALEILTMKGVQWCWDAISKMLKWASQVKELVMKVEFCGDHEGLKPFNEVDLVDFFNGHPNLRSFDIHGAMFAALCQKNSLKNVSLSDLSDNWIRRCYDENVNGPSVFLQVDTSFWIPCLEEVVITVRSPLNAEQKMNTLKSLKKYGKNLKTMKIRILQMKSNHGSADDFFLEVCEFVNLHRDIVSIE